MVIVCPECGGEGYELVFISGGRTRTQDCSACGGTGEAPDEALDDEEEPC